MIIWKVKRMVRLTGIFLFLFLICNCGFQIAGTSTETTNGFTVSIVGTNLSGTGLLDTRIGIYSVDYNPVNIVKAKIDTLTVSDSIFNISGIKPGYYNVLIQKILNDSGYCIQNVLFDSGALYKFNDTLKPTGRLHGKLPVEISVDSTRKLAYLMGTPFSDTIKTDQQFLINKIPAGNYMLFFQKISTGENSVLGAHAPTVKISSGMQTEWGQ